MEDYQSAVFRKFFMKMNLKFVGILVTILLVGSSMAGEDPTLVIKYKKLTIKTEENPYFGELTSEISEDGILGSAKVPLKKEFPDTVEVTVTAEHQGIQVAEFEDFLCEMMKNELYGKEMMKHGLPKDKFPKGCLCAPGEYEISKYPIPVDRFPSGTPTGDYFLQMRIGESDKDPWITIDAEVEISHEIPKLPAPGLGR